MSKGNLQLFMSKVADSEELQAKIGEEIDAEALIALGAECGCEFTAEELQDMAELSDEELDGVAGGRRGIVDPQFIVDPIYIVDPVHIIDPVHRARHGKTFKVIFAIHDSEY